MSEGNNPNNISPIFTYRLVDGASIMWMGDLETTFMETISETLGLPRADILFAPHHGRASGKVPQAILNMIDPRIVIVGEAPSSELNYYKGYHTITQNTAGDITLKCESKKVHIFVSNTEYSVNFLKDENQSDKDTYLGTLIL